MRGSIQPNHIALNKYTFGVIGLPPLTPITVSGLEEELETVELPDKTRVSGGNTKPVEFTVGIPMHHTVEITAMKVWFNQAKDSVHPQYKKAGNLSMKRIGAGLSRTLQLGGMFITKMKEPDLELANEGEMAVVEFTISADTVS